MLTYLFTIITGIIFGWITMISVEDYWTDTYYKLAIKTQREQEKKQKQISEENTNVNNPQQWDCSSQS